MITEITQLWAASERHAAKFATLRGTIAYVQRRIQWMHEHWDYDADYDNSVEEDDGNDVAS